MKKELILHVSTQGSDGNDGLSSECIENGVGPLATIHMAFSRLRDLRSGENTGKTVNHYGPGFFPGNARIIVHGGRYFFDKPLVLTSLDSAPITVEAADGDDVYFDGGVLIDGWQNSIINGVNCWEAEIPEVFRDNPSDISQLFVNGKRAVRPRYPETGFLVVEDSMSDEEDAGWKAKKGSSCFKFQKDDLFDFHNLEDVDMVALHYWIEEHLRIKNVDEENSTAEFLYPSYKPLVGSWNGSQCPYYLENVFENFKKPGQFYADTSVGKLYYIPLSEETLNDVKVIAPYISQLLCFKGDTEKERLVRWIKFSKINFEHTLNMWPGDDRFSGRSVVKSKSVSQRTTAAVCQAAVDVPGVIYMEGTENCSIENCTFSGLGWYAIDVEIGCQNIRLVGNEVKDCFAGGFKVNGSDYNGNPKERTGNIRITDNHIHDIGGYYHCSVGIIAMHAYNMLISHNSIHDLYYSAISVGWMWGYRPSVCKNNIIEYNHLYNIGKELLSDMGGVYVLGSQPGSVIRNNLIHDIKSATYGGWGIYPDEGSTQVIVENNVVYSCNCSGFHQHYGRENTIRNNIFAFGDECIVALSRQEEHLSFTMQRNIFLSHGSPIYSDGYGVTFGENEVLPFDTAMNTIWDLSGKINIAKTKNDTSDVVKNGKEADFTIEKWKEMGYDNFTVFEDPGFKDPLNGDFTMLDDSPAYKTGFKPIDISTVGPRKSK